MKVPKNGAPSIVDPNLELLDPCPDVYALFTEFDARFFEGRLTCCELKWNSEMTMSAGMCLYQEREGLCTIRLSRPLLSLRSRKDLVETLLHEMIHAFLFLTSDNTDHEEHGPEFQFHMDRINSAAGTRISAFHAFFDEVELYQMHWCDGPCRKWKPFYGEVRRENDRAPGPNDDGWLEHQQQCGGKFTKVHEPEGYRGKKGKKADDKEVVVDKKQQKIDNFLTPKKAGSSSTKERKKMSDPTTAAGPVPSTSSPDAVLPAFTGTGQRLGGDTSIEMWGGHSGQPSSSNVFPSSSSSPSISRRVTEKIIDGNTVHPKTITEDEAVLIDETPASATCPVCTALIPLKEINAHLDTCLLDLCIVE